MVTARDGRAFEADQVVLAAPLKAVAALDFSPPLSEAKRRALAEVPMGSIAKVAMEVDGERWLDGRRRGGVAVAGLPASANAYTAAGGRAGGGGGGEESGGRCVVTVYAVGEAAEHIASLPPERRVAAAAEAVGRSLTADDGGGGGSRPALREPGHVACGAAKVWREDTSSRGAYAFFRPGQISARPCGPAAAPLMHGACAAHESLTDDTQRAARFFGRLVSRGRCGLQSTAACSTSLGSTRACSRCAKNGGATRVPR